MLYSVREDLDLCKEFKLTPRQLMFVKMLVKDPSMDEGQWRKASWAMSLQFKEEMGGLTANEIADLQARNIIIDYNEFGQTFYDSFEINPKFVSKFMLKVYPMVSQLYDRYPKFFKIKGERYIGRNATLQELSVEYLRAINKDPEEHNRVMDDVKWAIENDAIIMGIKKFVGTRYWEAIRELRKESGNNKFVDNVRIV